MNFYYTIHGIQINNIKSSIAVRVIFLTRELVCSKCTRNMRGSGGGPPLEKLKFTEFT